jgi:hypothetical protein
VGSVLKREGCRNHLLVGVGSARGLPRPFADQCGRELWYERAAAGVRSTIEIMYQVQSIRHGDCQGRHCLLANHLTATSHQS